MSSWYDVHVTPARVMSSPRLASLAMWFVAGALSVVFGVLVFAHPDAGAVTLALLFGFFSLALGITLVALGVDARRTGHDLAQI